jgi:tetratricopeptide (TPR) repeat protein
MTSNEHQAAIQSLTEAYRLRSLPEWQKLLLHLELGEGFSLVVMFVPDADGAEVCRQELARHLAFFGQRLLTVDVSRPDLLSRLPDLLFPLQPDADVRAVWIAAAVSQSQADREQWEEAWFDGLARLNERRNLLQRHFAVPLILVSTEWLKPLIRETAPDLWSIRSLVCDIEPPPPLEILSWSSADEALDQFSRLDPYLALREAEQMRGQPGKELLLARLLQRAGEGFLSQNDWQSAETFFRQAVELMRAYPDAPNLLARSLYELGYALSWQRGKEAKAYYLEARALFHQLGDQLGEATCSARLGEAALDTSAYNEAQSYFEEALSIFRQVGSVAGEAVCIARLGDTAFRHGEYDEAQGQYEKARLLFRQLGDVLGEANCTKGLGDVAIERSSYKEAESLYKEAARLSSLVGNILGEASCTAQLGRIASHYSRYDEARARTEEALILFRQFGSLQGQANCFRLLGDVARKTSHLEEARSYYETALKLYTQIPDSYSMGWVWRQLARLSSDEAEKSRLIEAARQAWRSLGRLDLVRSLEQEFS